MVLARNLFYSAAIHFAVFLGVALVAQVQRPQLRSFDKETLVFDLIPSDSVATTKSRSSRPMPSTGGLKSDSEARPLSSAPAQPVSSSEETTSGGASQNHANLLSSIRQQIEERTEYPTALRRKKLQGKVEIELKVDLQGEINSLSIYSSSGSQELDLLALQTIRNAAPFRIEVNSISAPQLVSLRIPIEFRLH
jgi:TonB family protein